MGSGEGEAPGGATDMATVVAFAFVTIGIVLDARRSPTGRIDRGLRLLGLTLSACWVLWLAAGLARRIAMG